MAALAPVATRTIFVHPDSDPANLWPTHRLLADLGHEVSSFSTLQEALEVMRDDSVDLLILEEPSNVDAGFRQRELERVRALPTTQQPLEIAIFSDRPDDAPMDRSRNRAKAFTSTCVAAPHVHILLKPLHMHGLLQLVRQLHSRVGTGALD